ncbi:MAG: phage tail protein [Pseudomonadota bacterium]
MSLPNLFSLGFLLPGVAAKIDFSRAIRGLRGMPRRLLLITHKLAAGNAAVNTIMTVTTDPDAVALFGEGSLALIMWRAAKANADRGLPIDVICIAEGNAAGKAASIVVITTAGGTLGVSGEFMFYIGSQRIAFGLVAADTPTTIAAKLAAAISAVPKLPVTAATNANAGEVVVTCKWGGATGNDISLVTQFYPDDHLPVGLTVTIPAMAGGNVAPDVTPVITKMLGYRATEIVNPFTDSTNMGLLENEMAVRWLANNMRDGAIVVGFRGTEGAITTHLASRNSPHVHTMATTKDLTSPFETAAMAAACIESGCAIDPALPPIDLLVGYVGPKQGDDFTDDQKGNLLALGGSPLQIDQDGTGRLLRMVTNYTQTSGGAADRSMANLMWIKTMSYYRWFVCTEFLTKYRGYKLAQYITDPIPGQKIMTPQLGEEIMLGIYKVFTDVALMQNTPYYQETLVVEVDGPNEKLKILDEPVIVTQHYQTEITSYPVAGQV